MNSKPILFNTDMVRAILDNRKTVTRRVVKLQKLRVLDSPYHKEHPETPNKVLLERLCEPPYRPGDILYVRETWCPQFSDEHPFVYKASVETPAAWKWRPSIHMPREAARIFLKVTDVRVEQLWDVSEVDILEKEGVTVDFPQPKPSYMSLAYAETRLKPAVRKAFADLWDSVIKKADRALYGWAANPWVWVIEFERINGEDVKKWHSAKL